MAGPVFAPALDHMTAAGEPTFGPTSFLDYVDAHDLSASGRTPKYISIDAVTDLRSELRAADTMVLRLGSAPDGRGTQFALVRATERIEEFFLVDSEIVGDAPAEPFTSDVAPERMIGFRALPNLSETSLVNLGLASGVIREALEIDGTDKLLPPATGRSHFSFTVRPHSGLDVEFHHRSGQVEVDTLFAERRDGQKVMFVIEAKTGSDRESLAKHKLAYPIYAVADRVPDDVTIVPIYLRIIAEDDAITFNIVECEFPDPREGHAAVDEVRARRFRRFELEF